MLVSLVISSLKDRKKEICTELNDMINVPMVSEKKEQACIESIFDAVIEVLTKVLSKV
tara:strand:- start:519 stop:692 length:174 start_codon:yes stop_codon:yes gene_type:complete